MEIISSKQCKIISEYPMESDFSTIIFIKKANHHEIEPIMVTPAHILTIIPVNEGRNVSRINRNTSADIWIRETRS